MLLYIVKEHLSDNFQVADFAKVLYDRGLDTLTCLSLSVLLIRNAAYPALRALPPLRQGKITCRFMDVEPTLQLVDLKSSTVGKFVGVRGTVIRCSSIKPLVLKAMFECPKCGRLSIFAWEFAETY